MPALLSQLPPPPAGNTGWPWTGETPPAAYETAPAGGWPRLSIVCPSFQQGRYLEETIRSVLLQNYPNLEFIVMDGGSTDETPALLARYAPWLAHAESQADRGQAHALNKACARATGELLGWINSDDYYLPGAFAAVARQFRAQGPALLYGDEQIQEDTAPALLPVRRHQVFGFQIAVGGVTLPSHATFWPRAAHQPFNEALRFTMDAEFFKRLTAAGLPPCHVPEFLAVFRRHGASKTATLDSVARAETEAWSRAQPWHTHWRWRLSNLIERLPPDPDMSDRPAVTRIIPLDGLRGIAIGLVLLHHYVQLRLPVAPGWAHLLDRILKLSWSGVDLFFVLSGFLIGGLLIDHRDSPQLVRVFYLRRTLRIMPLYFLTLLVLYLRLHVGSYSHLPAWVYFTFTSNVAIALGGFWDFAPLSVMWSLAVEEQFYLFAPWAVRWTPPERLPRVLLAAVAIALAVRVGATCLDPSGFSSHLLMPCRMDAFSLGLLAAWAARSARAREWIARRVPDGWVAALVAIPALVVLTLFHDSLGDWNLQLFGYPCLALFYASVVYALVVRQPRRLVAFLTWRPLVSLGRLSYFIYLWHIIVLLSLGRHLMGSNDFTLSSPLAAGTLVACLAATWALAWVSWRLFESPLIRLGHRCAY